VEKLFGTKVINSKARLRPALYPILLIMVLGASGCAVSGNSLPTLVDNDALVTSSVASKTKAEGIAETDAEVIKEAVATAKVSSEIAPLAWVNPQTGSSGTIVAIDKFMGKHGQRCRGFKTSVDSFMGIAFYNGEACQISAEKWVLSWFKATE